VSNEDKTTEPLLEILAKVRSIDSRLTALEQNFSESRYDTRPIWQQVLQRLEAIEKELKKHSRQFDLLHEDIYKLREADKDLSERIDALEQNSSTGQIP